MGDYLVVVGAGYGEVKDGYCVGWDQGGSLLGVLNECGWGSVCRSLLVKPAFHMEAVVAGLALTVTYELRPFLLQTAKVSSETLTYAARIYRGTAGQLVDASDVLCQGFP